MTAQATLYPRSKLGFGLLKEILDKAYWPIFGEMKVYDKELDDDVCDAENQEGCPTESGVIFTYVTLMVYMIAANVLLINLLIAMFR